MRRKLLSLAGACALIAAMGLAVKAQEPANVAGTWQMTMEGRQGQMTQTLTIEQDGGAIKGTVKGERGPEANLEGTVDGNKISFTVKRQTPRGEMTTAYTGTVDGDTIKGTMQMGEMNRNWSATRQK
jgi:hypothetical protein